MLMKDNFNSILIIYMYIKLLKLKLFQIGYSHI